MGYYHLPTNHRALLSHVFIESLFYRIIINSHTHTSYLIYSSPNQIIKAPQTHTHEYNVEPINLN